MSAKSICLSEPNLPPISYLPSDVTLTIFSLLSARDLLSVGCVNKHWNGLSTHNKLWKDLCTRDFVWLKKEEAGPPSWKTFYLFHRQCQKKECVHFSVETIPNPFLIDSIAGFYKNNLFILTAEGIKIMDLQTRISKKATIPVEGVVNRLSISDSYLVTLTPTTLQVWDLKTNNNLVTEKQQDIRSIYFQNPYLVKKNKKGTISIDKFEQNALIPIETDVFKNHFHQANDLFLVDRFYLLSCHEDENANTGITKLYNFKTSKSTELDSSDIDTRSGILAYLPKLGRCLIAGNTVLTITSLETQITTHKHKIVEEGQDSIAQVAVWNDLILTLTSEESLSIWSLTDDGKLDLKYQEEMIKSFVIHKHHLVTVKTEEHPPEHLIKICDLSSLLVSKQIVVLEQLKIDEEPHIKALDLHSCANYIILSTTTYNWVIAPLPEIKIP